MKSIFFEELDFDLGHLYRWHAGSLELFGSWNWNRPFECSIVVSNKRFYGFTILDLPVSKGEYKYEYKWKFTSEKSEQEWMNDRSNRPHVSCFNNQQLIINDSYDLMCITERSLDNLYKLEKKYKLGDPMYIPHPVIEGFKIMNFQLCHYDDCNGRHRGIIHDICENIMYYDLLNMKQQQSVIKMVLNKHKSMNDDITGYIMRFINPFLDVY